MNEPVDEVVGYVEDPDLNNIFDTVSGKKITVLIIFKWVRPVVSCQLCVPINKQ